MGLLSLLIVFWQGLRWIKFRRDDRLIVCSVMAPFLFTCPTTLMKVQHWLDTDVFVSEDEYEQVSCPACSRLHFLNRKTGRLLGEDES